MKKIGLLLLSLGFLTVSCSSDESGDDNTNVAETNFLPLATGNYWVYDVPGSIQDGRDSLYVANDTVIGSTTYKKFKTESLPTGFFTGAMSNNGIRVSGDELLLSGTAAIPFSMDFPVSIAVSDFTIFKESAPANTVLDNVSGTISQEYEGYPLDFDYTLTAKAKEDVAAYSINGHNYTNVKVVETVLKLKISSTIDFQGTPATITLLPEQNVVVSTQYYAEGIGVVHVKTNLDYQLAQIPIPGYELPIPQSASENQQEILEHYSIE